MEPAAAQLIWSRSVEKHKLCYTTFIGDGNSKSYQLVSDMKLDDGATIYKENVWRMFINDSRRCFAKKEEHQISNRNFCF